MAVQRVKDTIAATISMKEPNVSEALMFLNSRPVHGRDENLSPSNKYINYNNIGKSQIQITA